MDMLATSVRVPTVEEVRSLSISDLAIASSVAEALRERLREFVQVDAFCVDDPFDEKDDFSYSVVLDRQNPNRVIAMIASKRDSLPQLPWSTMLGQRLVKVSISKEEAFAIKREMMPKETNNFYPYRRGGKISGFMMFSFQVCGQR